MKSSGTVTNSDPMNRSRLKPGQKKDYLTLIRIAEVRKRANKELINVWECKCECGNICTRTERTLLQDNIHSCG